MNIFSGSELGFEPADPRNFVGNARVRRLPMVEGGSPVTVYLVDFSAGGRTNWHIHSAPQLLLVVDGSGFVQKWGGPIRTIAAGDAVTIEPNEKHWHGAATTTGMSHFAVNLNLQTTWLEPVTDDQYRAS